MSRDEINSLIKVQPKVQRLTGLRGMVIGMMGGLNKDSKRYKTLDEIQHELVLEAADLLIEAWENPVEKVV